jgi:hypothetical protein
MSDPEGGAAKIDWYVLCQQYKSPAIAGLSELK